MYHFLKWVTFETTQNTITQKKLIFKYFKNIPIIFQLEIETKIFSFFIVLDLLAMCNQIIFYVRSNF